MAIMKGKKMIYQCRTKSVWICSVVSIILSITISPVVYAQSLDINLSDDTAEFRYITPVGFENSLGNAELDLGFLSTTSDDIMGIVGFQAVDEAGSATPGLKVGVGVKAFAGTINKNDVYAIGLGGNVRVPIINRVAIFGDIHFAPDVVTFGDTERLLYINTRLEYEILPEATVYLGYRNLRANLTKGGHESIDNAAHLGLQFMF